MENLIHLLNNVSVGESKFFDEMLDSLINKLDNHQLHDPEYELQQVFLNHSKLNYVSRLIAKHQPDNPKFFKCLKFYLETIDKKTQVFLMKINWSDLSEYDEDDQVKILEMKDSFEESLSQNDVLEKLSTLVHAYSTLVYILDEIKDTAIIIDMEPEFKQQFKKRKRDQSDSDSESESD